MADSKPSGASKSRTGCSECKRKRVKCPEEKPVCSRCSKHPERCSYALKLSWTQGRPFKKPRKNEAPWIINLNNDASASAAPSPVPAAAASDVERDNDPVTSSSIDQLQPEQDIERVNTQSSDTIESAAFDPLQRAITTNDVVRPILPSSHDAFFNEASTFTGADLDLEPVDDVVERDDALIRYQSLQQPSVPPSLSTYPLLCPSESPSAYFFLHHYITHTSGSLFPLLAPSVHQEVLSIAAQTPHLLSAALALSCDQYRRLTGNDTMELRNRHVFFSRKALTGLRQAMENPCEASSFSTICTVLFLCTNEVMAGNSIAMRTHLRGAEHLLSMALGKSRRESVTDLDDKKLFLIRWFAVVDVFASIMSLDKTASLDGQFWSVGSPIDGSAPYIDEFVGFSLDLMPILARIGRMARLQQRRKSLGSSLVSQYAEMADDLDMLLADNILLTEQQLSLLFCRASSPSLTNAQDPVLAQEAQYTHQMFVHSALLHLYRRVQELPKPDPKPAQALASILDLLGKLRPQSPAGILILWPLFTAGCEAEDPELRSYIEIYMSRMRNYGWGNVDAALEVVRTYWAEGEGERWDVFLERRGFDVVLF